MKRIFLIGLTVSLVASSALFVRAQAAYELPTPLEHYDSFNAQVLQIRLFGKSMTVVPPEHRARLGAAIGALQSGNAPELSEAELELFHQILSHAAIRPDILELTVHRSGIVNLFGDDRVLATIFHDFLLLFLDSLSSERLLQRMVGLISVPPDAPRGERLLRLVDRTPTLQKVGQIVGRNPAVPEDMRASLQTLENSIRTLTVEQVTEIIREDVGEAKLAEYKVELGDQVLAEASVGAVIRCDLTLPGETKRREAVCKVIKPYIVRNLTEELEILKKVVFYFEEHGDFYQFGNMPLSEMFGQIADALAREVKVSEEQAHLREAGAFYRDDPNIKIPEIYPISSKNVTFMEFIDGGRIADAFPGDKKARAEMARRLSDALLFDVIFSEVDDPIFHGDPHAGNVFFLSESPDHPFRIALLDWGLRGRLPRRQRKQIIQLLLGFHLQDFDRIRDNASALIDGGEPDDPKQVDEIHDIARKVLQKQKEKRVLARTGSVEAKDAEGGARDQGFQEINVLVEELASAGYPLDFNLGLFVKSQVTIIGILKELDPEFDQDKHVGKKTRNLMMKEGPKRLLQTIGFPENFTKHNYRSMISNADLWALTLKRLKGGG